MRFRKEDKDWLAYLAMRFWREAEAPTEGSMHALFQYLLARDEEGLKQLLNMYDVKIDRE